jgi:hypothetical protein
MSKGQVSLDEFKSAEEMLNDHDLWLRVLKNVRAGVMPPEKKPQPTAEEKKVLEGWIKNASFRIDPANPDPGRVTVRRLNRTEYRNTIRDLVGVDFNTESEFPPDDTGHGFDNIGDVLTVSPMLLEKYITAAKSIVESAVPSVSRVVREQVIPGRQFVGEANERAGGGALSLPYSKAATVTKKIEAVNPGKYQVVVDLTERERFVDGQFDYNKVRVLFKVDGKERLREDYLWKGGKTYSLAVDEQWPEKADHELSFEIIPLTPDEKQVRNREIRINSVTLRGPMEPEYWVRPKNFERFFAKDAPEDPLERRAYAAELLEKLINRQLNACLPWRRASTHNQVRRSRMGFSRPWWRCLPRRASSSGRRDCSRRARTRSLPQWMISPWLRDFPIFFGPRCRTRNYFNSLNGTHYDLLYGRSLNACLLISVRKSSFAISLANGCRHAISMESSSTRAPCLAGKTRPIPIGKG